MALRLRETAAELYGCEVDEVIAGNGSDDILTIIFRTFLNAGDVLATPAPSYTLYHPLSAIQDAIFTEIPMGPGYTLPEDLEAHGAKVVIIVNPNAPTGVLHPRAALRAFLERTQSIVVIDEAYADFAGESAIDLLKEFPHLLVVRTFSKAYALAGMRLGLGFARREIIAEMMKVKDSYNLDSLAIVAGCAALQDQEWLHEIVGMIVRTRTWMQQELEGMGLHVPPSHSNFVFPSIPNGRAAEVFEALEKRRILVRYFRGPLVQDSIRISVGTDADTEACLQALHALLA
jgi:histidinol-phosphate aminotransferase